MDAGLTPVNGPSREADSQPVNDPLTIGSKTGLSGTLPAGNTTMFNLADFMEDEDRVLQQVVERPAANDEGRARHKPTASLVPIGLSVPVPEHVRYTNTSNGCDFFRRPEAGLHIPTGRRF